MLWNMTTAKRILGNTAFQVMGRGVMAVTSVVILKAISNFLSVEGYGMYTAIYEFLAFFGIVADLGLFTIAVREMGKGARDKNFIAGNIFAMRMVLALMAMSFAVVSAFIIPQYQGTYIPVGVAIASLAVFLAIMHGTVSSVLQVELKMERSTIGLVGGKIISLGWMLAVIYYFFAGEPSAQAFYQLIVAGVVGNLFAFSYTFYYALRFAKIKPQFDKVYWKEIFMTAAPYGAALVLNMVYFRIDAIMLLLIKGPLDVGLYAVPMRILEILSVIPVYFMNSVLPVLSKAVSEGGKSVKKMLQMSFDFLVMSALPVVVGLYVLAYPIIFLISSPEFLSNLDDGYFGSDIAMKILVGATFFSFINSLFTYSLIAVNKQSHLLWINGSAAIMNIVANLIVIPIYGFRGAAATSVVTEAYILLMAWLVARKYLHYKLNFLPGIKAVIASVCMGVVVHKLQAPTYSLWGLQNLNVLLLSVLGAIVYLALLLLMRAVPKEVLESVGLWRAKR